MSNSAQVVAEQVVTDIFNELDIVATPHERGRTIQAVIDALTTFAAHQVQATWEEAAGMADNLGKGGHYHFPTLAEEFRRRAQEGRG